MKAEQFRDFIIQPSLAAMGILFGSPSAVMLLLCTAAQETDIAEFVHQENGPALGPYQMQPETHNDVWRRAKADSALKTAMQGALGYGMGAPRLVYDFRYATVFARALYGLDPAPLPAPDDIDGMWATYKRIWNTPGGAATKTEFLANCSRLFRGA